MLVRSVLVFLAAVLLDVVWTYYIRRTAEGRALAAAVLASLTIALGGFNVIAFVDDPRFLAPAALGAFIGTLVAVRIDHAGR